VFVALKGDGNVDYSKMSRAIRTFQAQTPPVSQFKMITDLNSRDCKMTLNPTDLWVYQRAAGQRSIERHGRYR
jgi:hypothetical protein